MEFPCPAANLSCIVGKCSSDLTEIQAGQGLLAVVKVFPLQSGGFSLVFSAISIPGFRPGEDDQHELPKFTQL